MSGSKRRGRAPARQSCRLALHSQTAQCAHGAASGRPVRGGALARAERNEGARPRPIACLQGFWVSTPLAPPAARRCHWHRAPRGTHDASAAGHVRNERRRARLCGQRNGEGTRGGSWALGPALWALMHLPGQPRPGKQDAGSGRRESAKRSGHAIQKGCTQLRPHAQPTEDARSARQPACWCTSELGTRDLEATSLYVGCRPRRRCKEGAHKGSGPDGRVSVGRIVRALMRLARLCWELAQGEELECSRALMHTH